MLAWRLVPADGGGSGRPLWENEPLSARSARAGHLFSLRRRKAPLPEAAWGRAQQGGLCVCCRWRWPGRPGSARWKGRPARASSPRWPRYRQNRSPGPHSGRHVAQAPPGFWGAALRRAREPAGLPGDTARGRREPQTSGRVRREGPPMADGGVDVDDAGCAGHAGPRRMPAVAPLTSPRAPHGGPRRTPVVLAVRKPVRLLTR